MNNPDFSTRSEREVIVPARGHLERVVRTACNECGAYRGHHPLCSRQSIEEKAATSEQYYRAWLRDEERRRTTEKRLKEQITFWQGKHAILCRENNALRKKIRASSPNQ